MELPILCSAARWEGKVLGVWLWGHLTHQNFFNSCAGLMQTWPRKKHKAHMVTPWWSVRNRANIESISCNFKY